GSSIAIATSAAPTTQDAYTLFDVSFSYFSSVIPDTAWIVFGISPTTGNVSVGSSFYLDDVSFFGTAGVAEHSATDRAMLYQNVPNPVIDFSTITFSLPTV